MLTCADRAPPTYCFRRVIPEEPRLAFKGKCGLTLDFHRGELAALIVGARGAGDCTALGWPHAGVGRHQHTISIKIYRV